MGKVNGTSTHIDQMYAFVAVDEEDGTEGICSYQTSIGHMPLIGADMARVDSLRPIAQEIATAANLEVRLIRFTNRTDVETLTPEGGGS